jgi:hypothetical protein
LLTGKKDEFNNSRIPGETSQTKEISIRAFQFRRIFFVNNGVLGDER